MEMKMASAYRIQNNIFIQGYAETTVGLSQLDGPVFITKGEDTVLLGQQVLEAIKGAGKTIPHPTQDQWKQMDKDDPMLKVAGVKTWNAMMKASITVGIKLRDDHIIITPHKLRSISGSNKGYDFLYDKAITCDLDPENIGRALLEAFKLCE